MTIQVEDFMRQAREAWAAERNRRQESEAAQEFAARYWDEPRLIENNHLMPDDSMQFSVVNGAKVYEARRDGHRIFINRLD